MFKEIKEIKVFWLSIPMINTSIVIEINCTDQLLKIFPYNILLELSFGYLVEELPSFSIFHDKVNLHFAGHNLIKLYHIWVSNQSHYRNLSLNLIHHPNLQILLFINYLNGNTSASFKVPVLLVNKLISSPTPTTSTLLCFFFFFLLSLFFTLIVDTTPRTTP
ncbi:unnamed protein product, partial [Vitis vinifera]